MRGVKFGHVFFRLKTSQDLRQSKTLDISSVACLSPGADRVWTSLSQEDLLFLKGGVLFFDSGNV